MIKKISRKINQIYYLEMLATFSLYNIFSKRYTVFIAKNLNLIHSAYLSLRLIHIQYSIYSSSDV
jgi:hypothetical protein